MAEPFTRTQVEDSVPDLQPSTVSVYLSLAKRAGIIEQVGIGRYRRTQPEVRASLSPAVNAVATRLRAELLPSALEQLTVWGEDSLAPFVHDGFARPFVVLEGSSKALEAASRALRGHRASSVRNHDDLGKELWAEDEDAEVFLLTSKRSEGTVLLADGFRVPTLGRLLIATLHMPALLPDAALNLLAAPELDLTHTIDALPSRRATLRLGAFLGWLLSQHPEHPGSRQAADLLPEGFSAW